MGKHLDRSVRRHRRRAASVAGLLGVALTLTALPVLGATIIPTAKTMNPGDVWQVTCASGTLTVTRPRPKTALLTCPNPATTTTTTASTTSTSTSTSSSTTIATGGGGIVPPNNPAANIAPTNPFWSDCLVNNNSQACVTDAEAAFTAARAQEGLAKPFVLPTNFATLDFSRQLLVVSNLERVDRGLPPISGLDPNLNALAQSGAVADNDPLGPPGYAWGSNWAGGFFGSTLVVSFVFMYYDGYLSGNGACSTPTSPGCWGHRDNILGGYGSPIGMGAGFTTVGGPSMTELFVSAYPGTWAFTWAQELPFFPPGTV